MIVLYTDSMAGSCVLCRNLLNYEPSYQAATRVYAVTRLDMAPPSPPGYQKEEVKHFSILLDPSPPPPPRPPPSPPRKPPPPLPAALGLHTETHIDCKFANGMDISVVGTTGVASTTDSKADTKHHCCSQCGMQAGCTDFVYEPSSKTCVLMPNVPSYQLKRSPNNSTIAGSVTISRIDQHHSACHFDVGSGYAGGALGVGKALPGKHMESKQDCCDACERNPQCAKFVYEHYGGDCQLYGPQAEQYFTFNLISGTVDSRAKPDTHGAHEGEGGPEDVASVLDAIDNWQSSGALTSDDVLPPIPPMFSFTAVGPSPSPPGQGEAGVAAAVLADFSLGMGFLILVVFSLFAYLFFAQDLNTFLYTHTGGRLGKRPKTLLPTREPGELPAAAPKSKKKSTLAPGWAKLTVQTSQLTQKKDVEVSGCETLEDLVDLAWEEFGHVLKKTKRKDMVLLVWISGQSNAGEDETDHTNRWALVNNSSDMEQVRASTALKLAEKTGLDLKALAVAFTSTLTGGGKQRRVSKASSGALSLDHSSGQEALSDGSEDERGNGLRRFQSHRQGGFEPLTTLDDDESGSDLDAPLCRSSSNPQSKARGVVNGRRAGRNDKSPENPPHAATKKSTRRDGGHRDRDRRRSKSTGEEDDMEVSLATGKASNDLVGRRVEIHGLTSKGELNGRRGVASAFDKEKGRYRVRLDAEGGKATVLAFMPANVRRLR
uniref:Apple domain-containing protein n=1 Tax=Haptolina brevifila TaxID=156173 RepID=A0A7S2JPV5_9EUKA|mmetsp:Transcript_86005/g.171769  ORF Transcript_86005/g.171769 Transcript_86005/m.171769 type:complete len:715 (+) Transcript_86005:2-2146(+)